MKDFDLEKWIPTEEDRTYVLRSLKSQIKSLIEDCGELEDAQEYKKMFKAVAKSKLPDIKDASQDYFLEMYHSVPCDMIEKCYDKETVYYLERILNPLAS